MYTQYRAMNAAGCLVLPPGTTPVEGASCFVNPLTALGMVETMRREGHTALVHTAAASNLGQMLQKLCIEDGIGLVNIVRKPEQAELLAAIGAKYVCDSSAPTFMDDLTEALVATGATHRVRRHRRRQAGEPDPDLHGSAPRTERPRGTAATARPRTSRSTSTAGSIAGRPCSRAASAWRGASAAGC